MKKPTVNWVLTVALAWLCHGTVAAKPLKVFILAGQSNMQGHAKVSTFDHLALDPETVPILKEMRGTNGVSRVCETVWISALGVAKEERHGQLTAGYGAEHRDLKIGPEFTFGIYMQKLIDEPILIIKTAWGGKSLHTDFRPPGAGTYQLNDVQKELYAKRGWDLVQKQAEKDTASGHYYRLMIEHVKNVLNDIQRVCPEYDAQVGYELAGFVWFQGWNDMVDGQVYPDRKKEGGYDQYSELLSQFIRDVRTDLEAPGLPFVIGVMGVDGVKSEPDYFRMAMAAPAARPEFRDNTCAVFTEKSWDPELGDLAKRWNSIGAKSRALAKDNSLSKAERTDALEKFKAESFTPQEIKLREMAITNGGYHYLGSAKIMARIGKQFAEAMVAVMGPGVQDRTSHPSQ